LFDAQIAELNTKELEEQAQVEYFSKMLKQAKSNLSAVSKAKNMLAKLNSEQKTILDECEPTTSISVQ